MAINVNTYTKHDWIDNSSPDLEAEILNEIETGIGDNNDAIKAIAAAVVSQIVNDPDKIASMAALYAVNQTLGNLSTTVTNINSNLGKFVLTSLAKVSFQNLGTNLLAITFGLEGGVKWVSLQIDINTSKLLVKFYDGVTVTTVMTFSAD